MTIFASSASSVKRQSRTRCPMTRFTFRFSSLREHASCATSSMPQSHPTQHLTCGPHRPPPGGGHSMQRGTLPPSSTSRRLASARRVAKHRLASSLSCRHADIPPPAPPAPPVPLAVAPGAAVAVAGAAPAAPAACGAVSAPAATLVTVARPPPAPGGKSILSRSVGQRHSCAIARSCATDVTRTNPRPPGVTASPPRKSRAYSRSSAAM